MQKQLKRMLEDLLVELKEVFDAEDIKWIEACRKVTDVSSLAMKIKNRGVQLVWMLESMDFAKTAHILDRNLRQVPLMHIQAEFRVYLDRLEEETKKYSIQEVKDIDSKEFIKNFLAKPELFKNIEMVMQAISVGCIKLSVESVAESIISKYNLHNNPLRRISEETAQGEMFISYNGPKFGKSDKLLSEAIWHFANQNNLFENEGKSLVRS